MREYHEVMLDDPFLTQQPGAECVKLSAKCDEDGFGNEIWVWYDHEGKRTFWEVAGAYDNAGAFWVNGIVNSKELAREYEEEILTGGK